MKLFEMDIYVRMPFPKPTKKNYRVDMKRNERIYIFFVSPQKDTPARHGKRQNGNKRKRIYG